MSGPFSAQIQRALAALGLRPVSGGGAAFSGAVGIGTTPVSGEPLTLSAGTGVSVVTVGGLLYVNTTSSGSPADTNENVLWTWNLPANTLSANGRVLRIRAFGTYNTNGNTKTPRLYFGTTVVSTFATVQNGGGWQAEATVIRTAAGAQLAHGVYNGNGYLTSLGSTPAADTTGAITIKVSGQSGTGTLNDIVFKGAVIEVLQ